MALHVQLDVFQMMIAPALIHVMQVQVRRFVRRVGLEQSVQYEIQRMFNRVVHQLVNIFFLYKRKNKFEIFSILFVLSINV